MFERFEKLQRELESQGYVYSYNENNGTHYFTHKDNEELTIESYDYLNADGDATDWDKVCDELEKQI